MDEIERFVAEQNVKSFANRLQGEEDSAKRGTLQRLMIAEEDKFAKISERLEIVERLVEDCGASIKRFISLLPDRGDGNYDAMLLESLLKNLSDLRAFLCVRRQQLQEELDEGRI